MKLNPDCVRDLLLAVEESCDYTNGFEYEKFNAPPSLKIYSHSEIMYHAKQCFLSGLIECFDVNDSSTHFLVTDLTPAGHEFLANIRSDNIFEKTKSLCETIGIQSLKGITTIASNVAVALIKSHFNLP